MIQHIVMFSFRADATPQARTELLAEYPGFPKRFPAMRNFTIGPNISERDKTFEYAFTVQFDNETDLKSYLNSEEHERHVVERFRPLIERRAIVSYEVAS